MNNISLLEGKLLNLWRQMVKSNMEFKRTFQSIIALHQEEFPFMLNEREWELPIQNSRIVTVTGIRRCGKSSLLGLAVNKLLQAGV